MAARRKTRYPGVFARPLKRRFQGRPDEAYEFCWNENGVKRWRLAGRKSGGCCPRAAAEARAAVLAERERGEAPGDDLTVADAAEIYLKAARSRGGRPASVVSTFRRRILPAFGHRRIRDIRAGELQEMHDSLAARLSGNYVRNIMKNMAAAISHCIRTGAYGGRNPVSRAAGFTITAKESKCERHLTREEAPRLLAELEKSSPLWHDMALVSLHTGARLTEIMKMTAADLSPDGRTAAICGKTGRREHLLLTPEAAEVLRRRADGGGPGELLFGRHCCPPFSRAVERLGLNRGLGRDRRHRVWFHTLRHTFASWMVEDDVDIYTVQKLLRHRSIAMTQRYAHLGEDRCRAGLEAVRRALAPKPKRGRRG
ncbi:MAG: site-specific integrase [Deltaproteobacteria bacterium]|nr:site-specific integrase [Deltaproteobacteria bacterium]